MLTLQQKLNFEDQKILDLILNERITFTYLTPQCYHRFAAIESGAGFRESNHGLELPDGNPPAGLDPTAGVSLTKVLVLVHQELGGFFSQLWLEQPRKVDVP